MKPLMIGVCAGVLLAASTAQAATSQITVQSAYSSEVICDVKHYSNTLKTVSAPARATRSATFTLPTKATDKLSLGCRARRNGGSGSWQRVSWTGRYRVSELNGKKITVTCRAGASLSCTPGSAPYSGGTSSSNTTPPRRATSAGTQGGHANQTVSTARLVNRFGSTVICTITQAGRTVLTLTAARDKTATRGFSVPANAIVSLSCKGGGKSVGWTNKFRAAELVRDSIAIDCGARTPFCRAVKGSQASASPPPASTSSSPTPAPVDTDGSDKSLTFTMKNDYKDPVTCTLKDGNTTLATLAVPARDRTGKSTRFAVPNTDYLDMVCTGTGNKKSPKFRVSASGLRRGTATKLSGSCYSGGTPVCNANAR